MHSSKVLSGIGFHVEWSRALRKDTARYNNRIEAAGGTTHYDPLDPKVSIILVFPSDWHATNLVVPVGQEKKNANALRMLQEWTHLDLISHFARTIYGTHEPRGRLVELFEEGRSKYTKVFSAGWLSRVIGLEGSIGELWNSEGVLPFQQFEVLADPRKRPVVLAPTTATPSDPIAARKAFLLSRPPHTPVAWLERAAGDLVVRKRRRASVVSQEEAKRPKGGHASEEETETGSISVTQPLDPVPALGPAESPEHGSRSSPQGRDSPQRVESPQRQIPPPRQESPEGQESSEAQSPPRARDESEDSDDSSG